MYAGVTLCYVGGVTWRHLALRGRHLASHGVTWHYVELRWPEVYLTSHVCWDSQRLDIIWYTLNLAPRYVNLQ